MSTLSFDAFWTWLLQHPNCVLRAGTADAVLFDDQPVHWQFVSEGESYYVQMVRGKRLSGEILLRPEQIAYVQDQGEEREGEWLFELVSETETERIALYFFVLTHGLEDDPPPHPREVH